MFVLKAFGLASSWCAVGRQGKDILHIDVAFPSVLVCRAFDESRSSDELVEYGNLCGFVQSSRYGLAQVVATLSYSFGRQRDRYDGVYAIEELYAEGFVGQ